MEIKFYQRIIYNMRITLLEYLTKEKVLKRTNFQITKIIFQKEI